VRLDVAPGHILWFGEMHGTWEAPRFVGQILSALDGPLQLGLEMPPAAVASLDDDWWTFHDGRSSEAIAELIHHARALGVALIGYDVDSGDRDRDRDRSMAAAVLAARDPNAIVVGLSGNVHSRKKPFEDITPCVMHLVDAGLTVTTYSLVASGGSLWACMPECGLHGMPPGGDDDDGAHDGVVMLGESTAAYPARR
jgi:hypothetical protein